MKRCLLVLLGLAGSWPMIGSGVEPGAEPAALSALRSRYQALLAEAEGPSRAQWLASLEALERQRAATGDFAGAAALRSKRLAWQNPGAASAAGTPEDITLRVASAKTAVGVEPLDAKKAAVRFRRSGAQLEWEWPVRLPGDYQVFLVCGVLGNIDQSGSADPFLDPTVPLPPRPAGTAGETDAGGVVEFRRLGNLKESPAVLRCSVRSTGGWAVTRRLPMGTMTLDGKPLRFSLKAVDALPAGVMDFHRLELVPVDRSAPADAQGLKELARLKEVYQKQFGDLTKNATAKYLKTLGEWEVNAGRQGDNDTVALVRQERKRLEGGSSTVEPADRAASHLLPVTEKLYLLVRGEAKLTNQGDYLTRMRPANSCEVVWKLAGLGVPSGTYQVEMECRIAANHGGTALLSAGSPGGSTGPALSITVDGPDEKEQIRLEKSKTFLLRKVAAGTVTIPKGSQYLTLKVDSLLNAAGALCELKSLRLTPVP